jgi:hypothetical protein
MPNGLESRCDVVYGQLLASQNGSLERKESEFLLKRLNPLRLRVGESTRKIEEGERYAISAKRDYNDGYWLNLDNLETLHSTHFSFLRLKLGEIRTSFPVDYGEALEIAKHFVTKLNEGRRPTIISNFNIETLCETIYKQLSRISTHGQFPESAESELLFKQLNSIKPNDLCSCLSVDTGSYKINIVTKQNYRTNEYYLSLGKRGADYRFNFIRIGNNNIETFFPADPRNSLEIAKTCVSELIQRERV